MYDKQAFAFALFTSLSCLKGRQETYTSYTITLTYINSTATMHTISDPRT